jgi:Domain of unknown function (4846)
MPCKPLLFFFFFLSSSCNNVATSAPDKKNSTTLSNDTADKNPYLSIASIPLPQGYTRVKADSNSFGEWLRNISLKQDKTVYTFSGKQKANQAAQFAVLDISVGNRDLQQCADAVMRLRAEYLFANHQYNKIIFADNEKKVYNFTAPYSKEHFARYLQVVFGMCGTASLAKQLKPVTSFEAIKAGDVIIRGGFPGHAVIVIDVATNSTGKKIYMLAQSYMPAQDIHVLVNPANMDLSPWYEVTDDLKIETPEYLFYRSELRQW